MKLQSALWSNVFSEDELKVIKSAVLGDKVLLPALRKVIDRMARDQNRPTSTSDIDESWALRRAHKDGRAFELEILRKLLEED